MSDDPRRTAPSDKTGDTSRLSAEGGGPTVPESRRVLGGPEVLPQLPGYHLVRKIGEGGMGAVYLAEDVQLKREVAVKTMRPEVAADSACRARFEREARAAAAVEHDNIVPILRVGEASDGTPFIVMPFLKGEMLDTRLKREPVAPPELILKVAFEVAEGLAAAHDSGLIHRDIKPGNIWLEGEPASPDPNRRVRRCKVLDFGLARSVDGGGDANLTRTGAVLGTPAYMSPEQARGERVDHRSDLFSLGIMLYRMATGQLPFKGATPMAALIALTTETPQPLTELAPHLPLQLAELINRLMLKVPASRPQSAAEVTAAVEQILAGGAPTYVSSHSAPVVLPQPVEANPWEEATEHDADEEEPVARRSAPEPPPHGKLPWIIAGVISALIVLIALAVVLRSGTPEGTLTVEVDPDAEAKFASGRLILYGPDGKERYRLAAAERTKKLNAGTYTVKVEGADGVALDAATFALKRGDKVTLRVSVAPVRPAPSKKDPPKSSTAADFREVHAVTEGELEKWIAALQSDGYIPSYLSAEAGPAVRFNGVAVPNPNKITWQFVPRDDVNGPRWQPDFLARQAAGFRPTVYAPYSDGGRLYEAHVWINDRRTGGGWFGTPTFINDKLLGTRESAYRPMGLAGVPDGTGARYRLVLVPGDGRGWDSHLGLTIDELAAEIARQKKRGWHPEWLAAYQGGDRVRFQALFCDDPTRSAWDYQAGLTAKEYEAQLVQRGAAGERPLSVVGYAADGSTRYAVVWVKGDPKQADAGEWVSLFNGKDLTGWGRSDGTAGRWHVEGNAITCVGAGATYLLSDRDDFADFHLRAEVKVNDKGNSGIYLRAGNPVATSEHYEVLISPIGAQRTGSLRDLVPVTENAVAADEWFTLEVIARRNRIRVLVNGKETADYTETRPNRRSSGHIALRHQGAQTAVQFRKIEVKELGALAANPGADRKAAEYVLSLGGWVRVDGNQQEITDTKALPADPFRLTGANMASDLLHKGQSPTADGLAVFAGCRHLRALSLHNAKLDERAYAHFAGCKELTDLGLDGTDVTDAALAHFAGCKGLKSLNLWGANRVGDTGLAHFKDCKSLTKLILASTQVTAAGLEHFKDCRDLDFIDLFDTRVGDNALKVLEDTLFATVSLQGTKVTDAGLEHLKKNSRLSTLSLIDTAVTDAGLEYLKGLPLVELNLSGAKVTAKGATDFAAAKPRCAVRLNGALVKPKE